VLHLDMRAVDRTVISHARPGSRGVTQ